MSSVPISTRSVSQSVSYYSPSPCVMPGMLCGLQTWVALCWKQVNQVKQVNKWSRMLGDCKH